MTRLRESELAPRQQEALARIRRLRPPAPPVLSAALLVPPPWRYRLAPIGIPAGAALILCLLLLPFLKLPEIWRGAVSLKSGSVVQLLTAGSQTIHLPDDQGMLILEGPATLEIARLSRHLLGGRLEGDLHLRKGELLFQAAPTALKLIQIQTPLLTVRVKGTRFLIGHRPDQGSRLQVLEGTLWIRAARAGNRWQKLPPGTELSVTPAGTVRSQAMDQRRQEREALSSALEGGPSAAAAANPSFPSYPIQRMLWHEEE